MAKMAVRIAHFLLAVLSGALLGYSFYTFRSNKDPYEALGAGIIAAVLAMILLPKLHKGGGGGGDF